MRKSSQCFSIVRKENELNKEKVHNFQLVLLKKVPESCSEFSFLRASSEKKRTGWSVFGGYLIFLAETVTSLLAFFMKSCSRASSWIPFEDLFSTLFPITWGFIQNILKYRMSRIDD